MLIQFLKNRYLKTSKTSYNTEIDPFANYSLGPPKDLHKEVSYRRASQSLFSNLVAHVSNWFTESNLRWIQIIKDLLTIAVALITVLKFIWPAVLWLWTWIST